MCAEPGDAFSRPRARRIRVEMQAVAVDQPVEAMGLEKVEGGLDADRIGPDALKPRLRSSRIGEACGEDRRLPVEPRSIA